MESKKTTSLSILMFPWLAHGHIHPYLELAKHLSTKNFTISLCSTPINLTSIREALKTTSHGVSINLIELDIPSTPELPPEYHTTKNIPPHLMPKLQHAFQTSRSSFSAIITSLKPHLLIYDAFQSWAAAMAASLSIPAVHFATTGAAAYSFYYHHFRNKNLAAYPYDGLYLRSHEWKALQAVTRSDENDGFSHFTESTDVILMKTSRGIEGKYIDYLSVCCNKKIVAVGPLITPHTTSFDHSHIMQWLSSKKQFSTVYISFGSENYLSSDQIEAIAKGLEKSSVNFIWVLRFPLNKKVSLEEALPEGFVDGMREKERGLIVEGWAPQTEILAHSSIGAFVSHCGMSSTVESVYFGVPIIGVPVKLDQPLNARLMVEAGVAVEIVKDENGGFSSEEVVNVMNKLFVEKTGDEMRVKAAELSGKMRSEEEWAVEEAAEQLRKLCMEHKLCN
ncbi:hypothetical protein ACS0TY_014305 [Phlomoides rotata]